MSGLRSAGAAILAAGVGLYTSSLHAQTVLPTITVTAGAPAKKPARPRTAAHATTPSATPPTAPQPAAGPTAASAAATNAAITGTPPVVSRFQLPQVSSSITAKQIEETINAKDPEDAVKYMPDLFVRKRNDGDNQAVLATRAWGLSSSARTLIYADDLLISALIGNNNTNASPHWNMVSPEAIARVDFLTGPYAAAYPGNSMGGVLLITTKMPDKAEAFVKETVSVMPWDQYGTQNTYLTTQTSASAGNRDGNLSWRLTYNHLDSIQQPLTYTTNASSPAGTTGTFPALNKQGLVADVVGTGALARSIQDTANLKVAYDVLPFVQATYTFGIWNNDQTSNPQTYLTKAGAPTFGGVSGFASNEYTWEQTHISNAVSLRSDTRGAYDFDISASSYNYLQDIQLNPFTVTTGTGFSQFGKITRNDGTNWQNADAKMIWRPFGIDGPHEISYGIHGDRYDFNNPVYASLNWPDAGSSTGQFYSDGVGETRTGALWAQDAWKIAPGLKLTLGGRLETWRALDGFNVNTSTNSATGAITSTVPTVQPELSATNFSPKASLSYDLNKDWNVTANFGEAWRYPTVTELYQNTALSNVVVLANPQLAPEQDLNGEINLIRKWDDGKARLTLFYERANNAIISQSNLTMDVNGNQVITTTIGNVDAVRMQGIELAADKNNVFVNGLQLFGSVTYVDSRILSDPTYHGSNPLTNLPDTATGKHVPNVPDWQAKSGFTYRPNDEWAWTVAGRYSGKQYSTLDNTDIVSHVFGAFDNYFVVDTKIHYEATQNLSFDFGIDNVFNEQYFLFHPFPGRTFVTAAKYKF